MLARRVMWKGWQIEVEYANEKLFLEPNIIRLSANENPGFVKNLHKDGIL